MLPWIYLIKKSFQKENKMLNVAVNDRYQAGGDAASCRLTIPREDGASVLFTHTTWNWLSRYWNWGEETSLEAKKTTSEKEYWMMWKRFPLMLYVSACRCAVKLSQPDRVPKSNEVFSRRIQTNIWYCKQSCCRHDCSFTAPPTMNVHLQSAIFQRTSMPVLPYWLLRLLSAHLDLHL